MPEEANRLPIVTVETGRKKYMYLLLFRTLKFTSRITKVG